MLRGTCKLYITTILLVNVVLEYFFEIYLRSCQTTPQSIEHKLFITCSPILAIITNYDVNCVTKTKTHNYLL